MGNVRGVGIDLVYIEEIRELDERSRGAFSKKTFSEEELSDAGKSKDKYEFLAGRFAVKEAVFKALSGAEPELSFDFRRVVTMRLKSGAPRVKIEGELRELMEELGLRDILISISNEHGLAIAIAEAVD